MLNALYANIGSKIKNCAKWIFIVEAACSFLTGFICFCVNIEYGFDDAWWALPIMVFGPLIAWVSSWLLYAFGEMAEDLHALREKFSPAPQVTIYQPAAARKQFACPKCGNAVFQGDAVCKHCGQTFDWSRS